MAGEPSGRSSINLCQQEELPLFDDALGRNELRKVRLEGPRGPMIAFERLFLPEGGRHRPAAFRSPLNPQSSIECCRRSIYPDLSLGFARAALVTAAALQVSFGLRPMTRLRRAFGAIGSGKRQLPGDFRSSAAVTISTPDRDQCADGAACPHAGRQFSHAWKTPLPFSPTKPNALRRGRIGGRHCPAVSAHAAPNRLSDRTRTRRSLAFRARHCRAGGRPPSATSSPP